MKLLIDTDRLFEVIQGKYESYIYFDQLENILKEIGMEVDDERSSDE